MQKAMLGAFTLPYCIEGQVNYYNHSHLYRLEIHEHNVSLYRPFVLQACESVRSSRLYEDFPWERLMNGGSILGTTISSASFHQHSLNLIIMRPRLVGGFQLEEEQVENNTHCLIPPYSCSSFHVANPCFV